MMTLRGLAMGDRPWASAGKAGTRDGAAVRWQHARSLEDARCRVRSPIVTGGQGFLSDTGGHGAAGRRPPAAGLGWRFRPGPVPRAERAARPGSGRRGLRRARPGRAGRRHGWRQPPAFRARARRDLPARDRLSAEKTGGSRCIKSATNSPQASAPPRPCRPRPERRRPDQAGAGASRGASCSARKRATRATAGSTRSGRS
jgi:hypothetical protein